MNKIGISPFFNRLMRKCSLCLMATLWIGNHFHVDACYVKSVWELLPMQRRTKNFHIKQSNKQKISIFSKKFEFSPIEYVITRILSKFGVNQCKIESGIPETDFAYLNACNTCVRQALKQSYHSEFQTDPLTLTRVMSKLVANFQCRHQKCKNRLFNMRFPMQKKFLFSISFSIFYCSWWVENTLKKNFF